MMRKFNIKSSLINGSIFMLLFLYIFAVKVEADINIDDFIASDVRVVIVDNTIHAVNNFVSNEVQIYYCWYINEITDDMQLHNIYKSGSWTENRYFSYTLDESFSEKNNYILISYIKTSLSDERVSRIVSSLSINNGNVSVVGKPLDTFAPSDLEIETNKNSLTIKNNFITFGPQQYLYYIYKGDYNNVIYKGDTWTDNSDFTIELLPGNYYIRAYVKDKINCRKFADTGPVTILSENPFNFGLEKLGKDLNHSDEILLLSLADSISEGLLFVLNDFKEGLAFNLSDDKAAIDWNVNFTESPNTYQLYLQALSPLSILSKAYSIKNDERYLKTADLILDSWIDYNSSDISKTNNMVWNDHAAAMRANNIVYYLLTKEKYGILFDDNIKKNTEVLISHAEWLADNKNYTKNHNHGIFQDQALILIASLINNENSEKWMETAIMRLQEQWNYGFTTEGFHVENSSAYFTEVLRTFVNIQSFLKSINYKNEKFNQLFDNIEKSYEIFSWLIKPNGFLASYGDSAFEAEKITNSHLSKNEHYLYYSSFGMKGKPHENSSCVYPISGYYFYREDNIGNDFINSTWKMLKSGYTSGTHKHADDLEFLLYSKGHNIFIDPGMYNYMAGNFFRDYFISPKAHNTITVDDRSYSTQTEESYKTGIFDFEINELYDHVLAFNNMYDGVQIDRHIYSLDDLTVIYDDIVSDDFHSYAQFFHLDKSVSVISQSDSETIIQIDGTNYFVSIKQIIPTTTNIIEGKITDNNVPLTEYGFYSKAFGYVDTTTTLKYSQNGESVKYITIISIFDEDGRVSINGGKVNKNDIEINENNLKIEDIQIDFYSRPRVNSEAIVSTEGNVITISSLNTTDNCIYNYIVYDRYKNDIIFSKELEENTPVVITFDHPYDYLLQLKIQANSKNGAGQLTKNNIGIIQYDFYQNAFVLNNSINANLRDISYQYEVSNRNNYKFTCNFDYDLDFTIKWYIYKNGTYYTSYSRENDHQLNYVFTEEGSYTVSFYLENKFGDKYYFNYQNIEIQ